MTAASTIERGRSAFAEHRWSDAIAALTEAGREASAADLECLSTAAFLTGDDTLGIDAGQRAHQAFLASGDATAAARSAAWLGVTLMSMGDLTARSSGWLARAQRLVEETEAPSAVPGLLLIPAGLGALYGGDAEAAADAFAEALVIGRRFHDADLVALARLGQGQTSIMRGEQARGLSLLDEAMVAVTVGEIRPIPSGIIYCAVIGTCHLAFDVRRARSGPVRSTSGAEPGQTWCCSAVSVRCTEPNCISSMVRGRMPWARHSWRRRRRDGATGTRSMARGDKKVIFSG